MAANATDSGATAGLSEAATGKYPAGLLNLRQPVLDPGTIPGFENEFGIIPTGEERYEESADEGGCGCCRGAVDGGEPRGTAANARTHDHDAHHQEMLKRGAQAMGFDQERTVHHFLLYEELLESVERGEWKSAKGGKRERARYSRYAKATFRKDRRLNIRLSTKDLEASKSGARGGPAVSDADLELAPQVRVGSPQRGLGVAGLLSSPSESARLPVPLRSS
jgi:hypothetical protein